MLLNLPRIDSNHDKVIQVTLNGRKDELQTAQNSIRCADGHAPGGTRLGVGSLFSRSVVGTWSRLH